MFSRAASYARRAPLAKVAAAGVAAGGIAALTSPSKCQGGGLEDRVASLEKTVASLVDKLQKAGDQLSSVCDCGGASHGPWRDETYAAKNEIHAPRYFGSYEEFGEQLQALKGEMILRDLLTKEMYDKVGRADSHLPRARVHTAPATPLHPRRPPPLHSTRTRRRRSA